MDYQQIQSRGIFSILSRKDRQNTSETQRRMNESASARLRVWVPNGLVPVFRTTFANPPFFDSPFLVCHHLRFTIHKGNTPKEKRRVKRNEQALLHILSETTTATPGAIFVSRIKSQVIMRSGDHVRARGIEGQVMRERERETERWEEKGCWGLLERGCYARVASRIRTRATLYQAADDALRNISRAYRTTPCVLAERLTLALRAVHSYSAGFNLICWSRQGWFNSISMFICIDILRASLLKIKISKVHITYKGKEEKGRINNILLMIF